MRMRCPGARALGAASLNDYRLVFRRWRAWRTGLADIEPSPGAVVWGVLWDIDEPCARRLDRYEGVHFGLYSKQVVRVEGEDAMVYVSSLRAPKRPSQRYLRLILRGAGSNNLPSDYVGELRRARVRSAR